MGRNQKSNHNKKKKKKSQDSRLPQEPSQQQQQQVVLDEEEQEEELEDRPLDYVSTNTAQHHLHRDQRTRMESIDETPLLCDNDPPSPPPTPPNNSNKEPNRIHRPNDKNGGPTQSSIVSSQVNDKDKEEEEDSCGETTTTASSTAAAHQQHHSHQQPRENMRWFGTPCRFVLFLIVLWMLQVAALLLLKKAGVVEPDFRLEEAISVQLKEQQTALWSKLSEQQVVYITKLLNSSNALSMMMSHMVSSSSASDSNATGKQQRPGLRLAEQGAVYKYPVVMVPGFVTSGLEVWSGEECAKKYFRQRIWTAFSSATSFMTDPDCWRRHMSLDPMSGGDPANGLIRLRACGGFEAADYFIANYWVWGKLIQNLADVGYTSSSMATMPYDWRVAYPILEERDGYFSRLKSTIEDMHKLIGRKVVLTSHSMGALVVHYFFAWVTASDKKQQRGGGGGGKKWVDEHIHSYINIAGSHLGVPKAATALLSGEMSDTLIMEPVGTMVEHFFGRKLRRDMWNTWGSLWTMLPKGGNALWNTGEDFCLTRSKNDSFCPLEGLSPLFSITNRLPPPMKGTTQCRSTIAQNDTACSPSKKTVYQFVNQSQVYVADAIDFLEFFGAGHYSNLSATRLMSFGQRRNGTRSASERPNIRTWHDPTVMPLPYAPKMRIYCLYGTGIDTERAYHYRSDWDEVDDDDNDKATATTAVNATSTATANDPPSQRTWVLSDPPLILDSSIENVTQNVHRGVRFSDGDGSVPILSLGYLCVDAWRRPDSGLNPSQSPVTTREFLHQKEFLVDDPMRGGRWSSEHVDMMGNYGMMEDFVRIVTDFGVDEVNENRIVSRIEDIASKINAYPGGGGIFQKKRLWKL